MCNAFACVSGEGTFDLPNYVVAFSAGIICSVVLAVIILAIKLIFFRKAKCFPVFAVASTALGVILGLFATFVVPAFIEVFESLGTSLPAPTRWLLDFRYLLWAPLLLIAISWRSLRSKVTRTRYYLFSFLGESLLLSLALATLYLPFFKLENCV
jgi:hypothetical protein